MHLPLIRHQVVDEQWSQKNFGTVSEKELFSQSTYLCEELVHCRLDEGAHDR